jgi:hypothetical protein
MCAVPPGLGITTPTSPFVAKTKPKPENVPVVEWSFIFLAVHVPVACTGWERIANDEAQALVGRLITSAKEPPVTFLTFEPVVVQWLVWKTIEMRTGTVPTWCSAGRNVTEPESLLQLMLPVATTAFVSGLVAPAGAIGRRAAAPANIADAAATATAARWNLLFREPLMEPVSAGPGDRASDLGPDNYLAILRPGDRRVREVPSFLPTARGMMFTTDVN